MKRIVFIGEQDADVSRIICKPYKISHHSPPIPTQGMSAAYAEADYEPGESNHLDESQNNSMLWPHIEATVCVR